MDDMDKPTPPLGPAMLFTASDDLAGLPVLSETQQLLAALLDGSDEGRRRAVQLIQEDPALCANLFRRCAQVLPRARPVRVAEALAMLGDCGEQALLAGHEVVRGLGDRVPLDLVHLREHSVNVALLARFYAQANGCDGDTAYLAGLLHEAGPLAVARHLPAAMRTLIRRTGGHGTLAQVCAALGVPSPLEWTVALLERFGVAPQMIRPLLALSSPEWPDTDPAAGVRDAVYRAHRLCEAHGGAAPWDRLPELANVSGPHSFAPTQLRGVSRDALACLH